MGIQRRARGRDGSTYARLDIPVGHTHVPDRRTGWPSQEAGRIRSLPCVPHAAGARLPEPAGDASAARERPRKQVPQRARLPPATRTRRDRHRAGPPVYNTQSELRRTATSPVGPAFSPGSGIRPHAPRAHQRAAAAHDRHRERRPREIHREPRSRPRPERELRVARHDHDPELLPRRDDLVVRLEIEGQVVVPPRDERLAAPPRVVDAAARERRVVLDIRPPRASPRRRGWRSRSAPSRRAAPRARR